MKRLFLLVALIGLVGCEKKLDRIGIARKVQAMGPAAKQQIEAEVSRLVVEGRIEEARVLVRNAPRVMNQFQEARLSGLDHAVPWFTFVDRLLSAGQEMRRMFGLADSKIPPEIDRALAVVGTLMAFTNVTEVWREPTEQDRTRHDYYDWALWRLVPLLPPGTQTAQGKLDCAQKCNLEFDVCKRNAPTSNVPASVEIFLCWVAHLDCVEACP